MFIEHQGYTVRHLPEDPHYFIMNSEDSPNVDRYISTSQLLEFAEKLKTLALSARYVQEGQPDATK